MNIENNVKNDRETIECGRRILLKEAEAIRMVARKLDSSFIRAVSMLESCYGHVVVTGIGKAGIVARKLSATLSSTGKPSYFLHPTEAMHGDLGMLGSHDLVMVISQSGETEEIIKLLPHVRTRGLKIIAITGRADSSLGQIADVVLISGPIDEACDLGLAPSASTAAQLALGDSLALTISARRAFTAEDFYARHPSGSLGRSHDISERRNTDKNINMLSLILGYYQAVRRFFGSR